MRRQLEQRATALGLLPGAVEFRGAIVDMRRVYREADILVLTSDYEGMPNVILEAMASGLPVVATRVGSVSEVVHHGETGYLYDAGDENSMLDGLLRLIGDPRERTRLGSSARNYIESERSLHSLPGHLENLYEGALA
jgi:glycosyltransferase involved in cell wall biosynthesis